MSSTRRSHRLVAGLTLIGGPAGALAVANGWVVWSTRRHRFADLADVPSRPTAIVLGAKVMPGGAPSVPLAERLMCGLALWRAGRVEEIVVSGARRAGGYDEPGVMRAWLEARGVPAEVIAVDAQGFRTYATMRNAAARGVRAAVVCTQAFHLARSVYLARAFGIDAVGVAADRRPVDPYARQNATREALARVRAVLDVAATR